AATSASFTMAYTKAGLSPDGSASYYLPRVVGVRRTQELMLTNRTLSAEEALHWGAVTEVVDDTELTARADALATQIASGAKGSHAAVKKLVAATWGNSIEEQMALEAELIGQNADAPDGKEGIDAFLNKRAPNFS
ncbi:MAG: enoyl-CoA hydratase-related protein, partial [Mycobacterium sp.]